MQDAVTIVKRGLLATLVVLCLLAAGCSGGSTALRKDGAGAPARLERVDIKDGKDSTTVVLVVDRPVTFTAVRVVEPPRLMVDLAGVELGEFKDTIKVNKGPISYITPSKAPNARLIARLEIGLTSAVDSATAQDGGTISITFEKPKEEAKAAASSQPPAPPVAEQPRKVVTVENKPEPQAARAEQAPKIEPVKKSEPPMPEAKVVKGVTYSKSKGAYEVSIEGDGRFSRPEVFMLGKDRLVVDLAGVGSTKEKAVLDVGGKPLTRVRMARHAAPQKKVRVVLDLAGASEYDVRSEGKYLLVRVGPPGSKAAWEKAAQPVSAAAAPTAKPTQTAVKPAPAPAPAAKPVAPKKPAVNVYVSKADGKAVLSSTPLKDAKVEDKTKDYVETATKIYTGGKISFDVQDADLDKVIKLLADVAGLNLIMDPADVKGKVTLKLDNVPWDQALDILMRIYNMDKVIEGNVLRVAPKARLDDEKRKDLLQVAEQKKLEQQAEDLYTKTFKINYTTATDIEPKVKKVLSARGDATANPSTNELIVSDIKANLDKAEKLIAILDKKVNQIMIEARIVTVDVEYSQSLGVSWGLTHNQPSTNPTLGVTTGAEGLAVSPSPSPSSPPGSTSVSHAYQLNVPTALAAATGAGGGLLGAFSWGSLLKDVNLDLTIQALEAISKAEVLAAPKVFTLENKAASITSGTTLYVQTTTAAGTAPAPLNANLSLQVTPRVTGDNFIMMDVTATNNTPATPPPGATASINTQAVTTSVIVKDGDTIVLGGIYTKNKSKGDSHVPLLGRIPIIRWLFSQQNWDDHTSELLIFITPRLLAQSNPQV